MAWKDLMVRVGMDSKGFRAGASGIKRDTQGLKNSMADLAAKMSEQGRQLRKLGTDGKGASNAYRTLKQEIRDNNLAYRSMARELTAVERAQGRVKSSAGGMRQAFGGIGSALTGGLIGGGVAGAAIMGIGALKQGLSSALNTAVSFDDSMRKVAATSSATGKQFEQLKNAAISMGAATRFTASQAGEALNYMALAGWNTEQSIKGLPGVLGLAAAAGTDLAMTSDILTDTMAAFGMAAHESTRAADIFAQVQSKSNTTVEQLGEAMKYAAPQAAAMGQTLESTATVLGLFANQGIKGTMAGTALNSIFRDMKKNADDGTISFGKMNIELYDQQGNFRDILDIAKEMKEGVKGLTQEQRNAITDGIFDERAIKGINILLNSTGDVINNLERDVLNATGRAAEMAEMMEGGVGGSLRKMKSAWEALNITMAGDGGLAARWYDFWAEEFTQVRSDINVMSADWAKFRDFIGLPIKIGPVKAEGSYNISNVFDGMGVDKGQPKGVFAPVKGGTKTNEDADKISDVKTAADAYRDFNEQLKLTREYLVFVGQEHEYVAKAADMYASAGERIFMMGGEQAKQYAAILKGELDALLVSTRNTSPLAPISTGMAKPETFKMPQGLEQQVKLNGMLAVEMMRIRKEAAAFGSEYDALGQQISAVSALISKSISGEIQLSVSGYEQLLEKLRELEEAKRAGLETETDNQNSMAQTAQLAQMMGQATGSLFESMASGYEGAGGALKGFAIEALNMAQTLISANLAVASSAIAKWAQAFGPAGPVIAAGAIAGVFGLVKGAIGKSKGVKLAKGGLAYGETMATVGDNPGARFDPEVVAPLSKLQGMLETNQTVGGQFTIRGADLVLAYDNAKRTTKAFGR